ncbi:hypothetical protein [Methylobacterium dankookense]|uniref:Uncharacterized protein n=1 Tax=Methylobacterium dankookense TaxID=560405 RepID=A0A564G3P3_9HYPH|nr:hypothetical protein [Methylobacterium dankookense]VUF14712.1 hypothetical protein MTDSW087_04437 [Methylobacterium dankookense]
MFVLNGASRRAARGARRDHSVIVIAFMMALVFVPVLGMHAAVSAGSDAALSAVAEGMAQVAKRFERQPG